MLKKLTKKGKDGMDKVKAGGMGLPLYPIFDCAIGCVARCIPELDPEFSRDCNGQVCLLIV
jgi:hypothetical protein